MSDRFFYWSFCSLLCLCLLLPIGPMSFAQEENPFGGSGGTQHEDETPSDGSPHFDHERSRVEMDHHLNELLADKSKLETIVRELSIGFEKEKARTRSLQNELSRAQYKNEQLKPYVNSLSEYSNQLQKSIEIAIRKELKSTDDNVVLAGLESLETLVDSMEQTGSSSKVENRTVDAVESLTNSKTLQIQKQSRKLISLISPTWPVRNGYQNDSDYWLPLEAISALAGSSNARRSLTTTIELDFVAWPIDEVVTELGESLRVQFLLDSSVKKDQLIDFSVASDNSLSTTLPLMLEQHKLDFVIKENIVVIYPEDHPDLTATLTYEVKGLVNESGSIMEIVSYLQSGLAGDDVKEILVVGETRLMVVGTEKQQIKVSRLLGRK